MPKHPAHNRQTSCVHKLTNIFAFCNNFSLSKSKFNKKLNLISAKSWQINEIIIVQDTYTHTNTKQQIVATILLFLNHLNS